MSDERDESAPIRSALAERDAMEELAWRFGSAEASIGIRAQNMGDVKGSSVFDESASHERHMELREDKHRWAVNRMRAVDRTLSACSPEASAALTLAFTPGGRVSSSVASHFEIPFGSQRASILGFALRSRAMRSAWEEHHEHEMPDQDKLIRLLESSRQPALLKGIMRGARNELQPFLDEYIEARELRLAYERAERERIKDVRRQDCDEAIRRTRERLWGK